MELSLTWRQYILKCSMAITGMIISQLSFIWLVENRHAKLFSEAAVKFSNELNSIDWESLCIHSNALNTNIEKFIQIVNYLLDERTSLKTLTEREISYTQLPWFQNATQQTHIQNRVKHLGWSLLQKLLTGSGKYFISDLWLIWMLLCSR